MRVSRRRTQKQIADMLYVTQSVYSKYEKGIVHVPIVYVIRLSKYYDVSVDYLLGLSDESEPHSPSVRFAKIRSWLESQH